MLSLKNEPLPPLDYLRALKVSHIVCHWDKMSAADAARLSAALDRSSAPCVFPSAVAAVYSVPASLFPSTSEQVKPLPSDVRLSASLHENHLGDAMDGDRKSAWKTGRPQHAGDWMKIDFPKPQTTGGVVMWLGANFMDYPRKLRVEGKQNGAWVVLSENGAVFSDRAKIFSRSWPRRRIRRSPFAGRGRRARS